jgi:predicted lipid-binding transport protein (Tim44 family)
MTTRGISRRLNALVALALCALIALAPGWAEARAGNSRSMGSRGYATQPYSPPRMAAPRPTAPAYRAAPPRPAPMVTPHFAAVHPFWSGMLGGFMGAGLAGMLFGHGFAPVGGGGAALGLLLQLALIGGLVYFGMRLLRRP